MQPLYFFININKELKIIVMESYSKTYYQHQVEQITICSTINYVLKIRYVNKTTE